MKINRNWFLEHLNALGLSQRQLAKRLKLDPSSITLMFNGKRQLKAAEAGTVAQLFGVDVAEVLTAAGISVGEPPKASDVPLVGIVGDRLSIQWLAAGGLKRGHGASVSTVRVQGAFGAGIQALRLETSGTTYDGLDGAIVLFRSKTTAVGGSSLIDSSAIGHLSVVTTQDRGAFIRIVRKGYIPGRFNLMDLNGQLIEKEIDLISAWTVVLVSLGG